MQEKVLIEIDLDEVASKVGDKLWESIKKDYKDVITTSKIEQDRIDMVEALKNDMKQMHDLDRYVTEALIAKRADEMRLVYMLASSGLDKVLGGLFDAE